MEYDNFFAISYWCWS